MPLYEYQCKNCGEINEILMKISDPNPERCEICEKGPMVKIMSRTHFVLKGQGWYETDFKDKKSNSGSGKSDKKEESDNKGSGEKKESSSKEDAGASASGKEANSAGKTSEKPASTSASNSDS